MMVQYLGLKDPLQQEMATHSSILSWKIPCTEEHGGLQSMGLQRVWHDWACPHSNIYHVLPSFSRLKYHNGIPPLKSLKPSILSYGVIQVFGYLPKNSRVLERTLTKPWLHRNFSSFEKVGRTGFRSSDNFCFTYRVGHNWATYTQRQLITFILQTMRCSKK